MRSTKEIHEERQEYARGIEEFIDNPNVPLSRKESILERLRDLNIEYNLAANRELHNILERPGAKAELRQEP